MRRGILCFCSVLLLAAACGGGGNNGPTPAATIRQSSANKIPDDFPDDFPLPQDRKVVYSFTSAEGFVDVFFASKDSSEKVRAFFEKELAKEGWKLLRCEQTQTSPEPITEIQATKDDRLAAIRVGFVNLPQVKSKEPFTFSVSISEAKGRPTTPPGLKSGCA